MSPQIATSTRVDRGGMLEFARHRRLVAPGDVDQGRAAPVRILPGMGSAAWPQARRTA
jgi:hypothetical protein